MELEETNELKHPGSFGLVDGSMEAESKEKGVKNQGRIGLVVEKQSDDHWSESGNAVKHSSSYNEQWIEEWWRCMIRSA